MNTKRKPTIDANRLINNPFLEDDAPIKGKSWTTTKKVYTVDGDNNLEIGSIVNTSEIEDTTYTRIYHDADYRKFVLNLSHAAMKLYTYITFKLTRNQDYLWVNKIQFKRESSSSEDDYQTAVYELERYGVIAYTVYPDTFHVNPYIMFCGNRLAKYKGNVKMR